MMGMMGGQQPPEPKGDINQLWNLLGIELLEKSSRSGFSGPDKDHAVVWQNFKPTRLTGIDHFTNEFVFVRKDAPDAQNAFNEKEPASAGLQELLILFPGAIMKRNAAPTHFEPLVRTGKASGTIMVKDVMSSANNPGELQAKEGPATGEEYVLAAHITGKPRSIDEVDAAANADEDKKAEAAEVEKGKDGKTDEGNKEAGDAKSADESGKASDEKGGINVIFVADIDMLISDFFNLRARRTMPGTDFDIDVDNVTFVLNVLDVLAGDLRFVEVRNRQPLHRPLSKITEQTAQAREDAEAARRAYEQERDDKDQKFEQEYKAKEAAYREKIAKMEKEGTVNRRELEQARIDMSAELSVIKSRLDQQKAEARRNAERKREQTMIELNDKVRSVQDKFKLRSVIWPPLLPLAVAFFVYFNRRSKEREGVSKARLR
jgi:ABC-2 type transport system permease protein